jgi:ABC-type nitrate/sulfonate/bicarbonate transport system permease component
MADRARTGLGRVLAGLPPIRGVLPLVLLLAVWQALDPQHSPYFPPPSAWWVSIVALLGQGKLLPALGSTLLTALLGLILACLLGGIMGILLGRSRRADRALGPLLEFCRCLPPPAIVPVAVLLLGYAQGLKLLVVVWVAVWPILLNSASATSAIEPLLVDVSRSFRLNRIAALRKIVVPSILPSFLLGVRVAVPLAIIMTLLVEMVTMLPGVGSLIVAAQRHYQSAAVYGLLVLIGLIGFVLNNIFVVVESALLSRWPPSLAR